MACEGLMTEPSSGTTTRSWVIGWLTSFVTLMAAGVALATVRRCTGYHHANVASATWVRTRLTQRGRVLVMVATASERDMMLKAVAEVNGTAPRPRVLGNQVVYELGMVSATQVTVARYGPDPASTAASLILRLQPDYLILTGVCFGLHPGLGGQSLGDVLVCRQVRVAEQQTVTASGKRLAILVPGDVVAPSQRLLRRFQAAQAGWTTAKVHCGRLLSGSTPVESRRLREKLLELEPEAVAGEMEGAGVYGAAAAGRVDWIAVKGISDWGYDRTEEAYERAAWNAAQFVVHTIDSGALDEVAAVWL